MRIKILLSFLLFFILHQSGFSQKTVVFEGENILFGKQVEVLVDTSRKMTLEEVMKSDKFRLAKRDVPNFQVTPHAYWVRFNLVNHSDSKEVRLQVKYPVIDYISFYQLQGDSLVFNNTAGVKLPFNSREIDEHQYYIYPLKFEGTDTLSCYLRVQSGTQILLPIEVGTRDSFLGGLLVKDLLFGIYMGIILAMILYNGFIYVSLRDYHYFLYIIYLISVVYTQASLEGYVFRFLLPDYPKFADFNIYISSALIGITAIEFAKKFLNSRRNAPLFHKLSYVFIIVYVITIILPFFGKFNQSYSIILISAAFSGAFVFSMAFVILRKGVRSARYFLIAWTVFIVSVIVFVMKDFGILPYNFFTSTALQIGSAFEAVMLSFALADRINIYRQQKESYQVKAFNAVKEKERIVREQNVMLEEQVKLRTNELLEANIELEETLRDLQEAEMQLVESEKMASLGQLTAGIAHEINNPINFVTSNVTPLKRDIVIMQDLLVEIEKISTLPCSNEEKQKKIDELKNQADYDYLQVEIGFLLKGISEGAHRTSDIVKGLRLFSRLDEDDIKLADINEGLEATISIIHHLLNGKIEVVKEFGDIPLVECYPGKLNQVFLNMLTNGIHAIQEHWGEGDQGQLTIRTFQVGEEVCIQIKDNGIGMSEVTQKKLFEPFFTTKEVGKGTGLGMSIGWNTINKHNGSIQVKSAVGEGTEFTIIIPIHHEELQND